MPTPAALVRCDTALTEAGTPFRDIVATYVNRGILKLRRGQIEAAIADFDTALATGSAPARSLSEQGRRADARRTMRASALPLFTVALENDTNRPAHRPFRPGDRQ